MSRRFATFLAVAGSLLAVAVTAGAAVPPARTPELVEKGRVSFERNCVACHGEKGEGDGPAAAALDPKPHNFAAAPLTPKAIFQVLQTGKKGTAMIAFTHLPEEERWALAYFVAGLGAKGDAKKK